MSTKRIYYVKSDKKMSNTLSTSFLRLEKSSINLQF